ncbi:GNAT family N-acetyltransferase [Deinococcus deserti]|uniref:GNAT family N-acetyltransferase n=1 Tax=Deinococcus deserti TaxID=310783 RepID=UPI000A05BE97
MTQGARPYGLIENVVTHDDARGQGIGTAVMTYVMDLSRTLNVYKVLPVTDGNRERITLRCCALLPSL